MNIPIFGGPWTEEKLNVLRDYLQLYTIAMKNQRFRLIYVDAFAGAGSYRAIEYGDFHELYEGSVSISLEFKDRFDRFLFIEKDPERVRSLEELIEDCKERVAIVEGDANDVIPHFCDNMGDFDRAVVFLDPYATQLSWTTVEAIAVTKKIDCLILFPLMAVTRMMPRNKEPDAASAQRLNGIFGEQKCWHRIYKEMSYKSLFGSHEREIWRHKVPIGDLYRERLENVFEAVASAKLVNSNNAPLFELFFAAGNPIGAPIAKRIAEYIFKKVWTKKTGMRWSRGGLIPPDGEVNMFSALDK